MTLYRTESTEGSASAPTWHLGTITAADASDTYAVVVISPTSAESHEHFAQRLRSGRLGRVVPAAWTLGSWPLSRCVIELRGDALVGVHTGRSELMAAEPMVPPTEWAVAAEWRQRVVLGLVRPGVLPERVPPTFGDEALEILRGESGRREVIAGLASIMRTES